MSAAARRGEEAGLQARRALLGVATFWVWSRLAWTLTLSGGMTDAALGRAPWLAGPLRTAGPLLFAVMAVLCAGIATRRYRARAAALAFALMWLVDFAIDDPLTEKSHILVMVMLLVHAGVGFWRGSRAGAERTAWHGCCAVAASAYMLSAYSKFRLGGIFWANPHYLQLLAMNATAQAHAGYYWLRWHIAQGPPLIPQLGGAYSLCIEALGPSMLFPRWRPYYLAAVLAMHMSIYAIMGIFWGAQMLLLFALLFPFEAAAARAFRLRSPGLAPERA